MASRRQAGERSGATRSAVDHRRPADGTRRDLPAVPREPSVRQTPSQAQLAFVAVPLIVAAVAYAPALHNGFIWDDPLILEQLRAIRSLGDLLVPPPIIPHFYFRPLIFVTYLIDRFLGGETPFWFHTSVVVFHGLNTLLVFFLARRLFPKEPLIAAGSSLLFAVFPTHVESVAWMAGRSDVVVCTFILVTVLLFVQRERAWSAWLGGSTFLLAMLSKEMAVAALVVVPLLDLLSTRRLFWTRYLPLVLATGSYFVLRQRALGAFVGGVPSGASSATLAADLLRALGFYAVQTVGPFRLCAYIPDVPGGLGYLIAGVALVTLGLGLMVVGWRHWQVAFLAVWFFAMLAPSLTVIVRRSASAVVADRYLYVPSVAACMFLAAALVRVGDRLRIKPGWMVGALAVLSAAYVTQVARYSRVWADDLTFWSDVAAKVPGYTLPHRELASALLERGRLADAERELQQGLLGTSGPEDRAMTYNNLGNLYRRLKRYDDAEHAFEAALKIAPHPTLYHNLGMTLMGRVEQENAQGDHAAVERDIVRVRDAFESALRLANAPGAAQAFLAWDGAKTHALLGQVLNSMGDRVGAREHLEASLRLQPTGPAADVTRRYLQQLPP